MALTYRILCLDDMEVRHQAFRHWFREHTLDEAKDAPAAINLLDNFDYDLVMLDHDLAEEHYAQAESGASHVGTGVDVALHIAKMPAEHRPKLVVIHSVNPAGAANISAALSGARVKFVVKPFDPRSPVRFK